ncbi:MAG: secretin and TonB N-terminal domain-containing protein, partial [Kiritimatiellaceae bacterium]|nr:secretin and TonB N-terminal domain-containing protein [Kiritimatiellaceae bacterium]
MKNLTPSKQTKYTLFVTLLSVLLILPFSTVADTTEPIKAEAEEKSNLSTEEPQDPMSMPSVNSVLSDYVSIQVDGGTIRQVMNAFALQTKRNVIIGPEVTNNTVTIHLNNVHWDNALEVILKPYGYGYRVVGNAIVVGELNRLQALETVEPLQSRVYELRFLDAGDAKEIIDSQLSPRGKMSIITARGQKGWSFGSPERRAMSRSGSTLQKRERLEEAESAKSKTLIISDVPTVLDRIEKVLKKVDRMPRQVLVESRFMEVNEDLLRDIGVEMGGDFTIGGNTLGLNEKFYDATPNAFTPLSEGIMGKRTLNTFGQIIGGDINS